MKRIKFTLILLIPLFSCAMDAPQAALPKTKVGKILEKRGWQLPKTKKSVRVNERSEVGFTVHPTHTPHAKAERDQLIADLTTLIIHFSGEPNIMTQSTRSRKNILVAIKFEQSGDKKRFLEFVTLNNLKKP